MKKILITCVLFIVFANAFTQNTTETKKEKIEAMRNAYITTQMGLNSEEAQKFWPIYNEYKKELSRLENPKLELGKTIEQMTEAEAKQLIFKEIELENQRYLINKKYIDRFLSVISAKKLIKLRKAEREFKKILIEQLKSR
jgi:hypothetical protein